MTNPIDVIANAIRAADGNHSMGAGRIAEVAAAAACEHIATFRPEDTATLYAKGWDDAITAILVTFGHGGA